MPRTDTPEAPTVDANPTKRFFVHMLTRDIELADSVLDLLDNCIDGIIRHTEPDDDEPTPYKRYWAKIRFARSGFTITDNCGGIDRDLAEKKAFRLGRPKSAKEDDSLATVGVYGIGMKRAIFKMGRAATVSSRTQNDAFEVKISERWLESDSDWRLPLEDAPKTGVPGTTVEITKLYPTVAAQFSDEDFVQKFIERVATHYAMIIHKGFKVEVNDRQVTPSPIKFLLQLERSTKGIAPYLYEGKHDGVEISIVVGFYRPMPTRDEIDEEQHVKRSREDAGWTVVCNDRVVLYSDKSRLTGWGEAGVPNFHTQFISIGGIVEFRTTHADKLPITTTKRGIDAGSDVYLFAKNYMREGMKLFTNYTNKWKEWPAEEKEVVKQAKPVDLPALRAHIGKGEWTKITKNKETERKFVPQLPSPPATSNESKIVFVRPNAQIRRVSGYLFGGDKEHKPGEVGAKAFDWVNEKAKP
jgi:hypothetical protein